MILVCTIAEKISAPAHSEEPPQHAGSAGTNRGSSPLVQGSMGHGVSCVV